MSLSIGHLRVMTADPDSDPSPAVGAAGVRDRRVAHDPIGAAPPAAVLAECEAAGHRARALAAAGLDLHLRPAAGCGRLIGELRAADGRVLRRLTPSETLDAMCGLAEL